MLALGALLASGDLHMFLSEGRVHPRWHVQQPFSLDPSPRIPWRGHGLSPELQSDSNGQVAISEQSFDAVDEALKE